MDSTSSPALKVELHTHTADDPIDTIPHTTGELIDRAAALGYDALAITLHDKQLDVEPYLEHAARRGLVLIPGIERTIEGRHILLLNFSTAAESVQTFEDLGVLKERERGIVIAPHPFFPLGKCVGGRLLTRYAALFDAVEINAMYAPGLNFNRRATAWASRRSKPVVGNGDVHRLEQLGSTYTLVEAERNPDAICEAIREGRVEVVTRPLGWRTAVRIFVEIVATDLWRGRPGAQSPDPRA